MPWAYPDYDRAVQHVGGRGGTNVRWSATLSVGRGAGHSAINLYADGVYCGTVQGDILGAALYRRPAPLQDEYPLPVALDYVKVLQSLELVYGWRNLLPWGTWICHDVTAAVLKKWGVSRDVLTRLSWSSRGAAYIGAHIGSKLAVPGTFVIVEMHRSWNALQDNIRGVVDFFRPGR